MTELQQQIADFITSDASEEDTFQALALEVFAYQYKHIELVRRVAKQGPVAGWSDKDFEMS